MEAAETEKEQIETDTLKEDTGLSLQELSRAVEDRTFWRSLIYKVTISWKKLDGT